MKRIISAITGTAILFSSASVFTATAIGSQTYEAEKAELSGTNASIADDSASGGLVAGNFSEDTDAISFEVSVPADSTYDITICSKGIGGDKINNILIDNQHFGTFSSKGNEMGEAVIRGALLTKGTHTITITKSWGWIQVDYLKISEAETISDSVYEVEPVLINPKATDNTKSLYTYLCESYGNVTLAGQVCDGGINGAEYKAIYDVTGKYPAMLGLDMMDYCPSRTAKGSRSSAVERAIEFYEAGGIVTFCWHWNAPDKYILPDEAGQNPRWWGGFYSYNGTFDLSAVMDGSDVEGKELLDIDIAEIAKQLNRLQEAGVPVLWRPLHEASGGWFWWGASGSEAYKKFWVYLYEELTNKYGCNNLIWVWNGQSPDWYPGDEYVDIIGEDIYTDAFQYTAHNSKFMELLEYSDKNKIIALTENGVVFDVDNMIATNAKWAWFNTWGGDFTVKDGVYSELHTEKSILKKAYDSEFIITLDELPKDLYSKTSQEETTAPAEVEVSLSGDANCDGKVSLADATAILQSLANPDKYGLSAQGKANGDVDDTKGISASDALKIKQLYAGLITDLK